MITHITSIMIYVADQAAAEQFWTEKVGFEVSTRHDLGNGAFWIEVGPAGGQTRLVLCPRSLARDWAQKRASVAFHCDDVLLAFAMLKAAGVEVGDPPREMAGTHMAMFRDPDGNVFVLKG